MITGTLFRLLTEGKPDKVLQLRVTPAKLVSVVEIISTYQIEPQKKAINALVKLIQLGMPLTQNIPVLLAYSEGMQMQRWVFSHVDSIASLVESAQWVSPPADNKQWVAVLTLKPNPELLVQYAAMGIGSQGSEGQPKLEADMMRPAADFLNDEKYEINLAATYGVEHGVYSAHYRENIISLELVD